MKFQKLGKVAKERARDWYREINLDYNWWDMTYEDMKVLAKYIGFDIEEIYFSGFCSQGDGACFTGTWYASDVKPGELKANCPQDETLHRIAAEIERIILCRAEASMTITHNDHYYHSRSVEIEVELGENTFDKILGPVDPECHELILVRHRVDLRDAARDLMDWLYDQLEKEHDWLQSDEAVDESIKANEYDFYQDGSFKPERKAA